MKCQNCRKKIVVHITVRMENGKLAGPFCERCAERVASGSIKVNETNSTKEAA